MDKVIIDNKHYDPYFILSVTPNDSTKHITKAFRIKAKVLHPDKFKNRKDIDMKKINKHFQVLLECYQYIIEKRKQIQLHVTPKTDTIEVNTSEVNYNLNNFGYGETKRLNSLDEYDEIKPSQIKIFKDKNFNKTKFNRVFEYNESLQEKKEDSSKELIHQTSDGFFAHNSTDWGNCSLVKSFNGLLIAGDDLGESGIGYSNSKYSDYQNSFSKASNPEKILDVPCDFKQKHEHEFKSKTMKILLNEREHQKSEKTTSFEQEKLLLLERKKQDLKKKIQEDKIFIERYSNMYNNTLIEDAKSRRLKTSSDYVSHIDDNLSYDENIRKNKITGLLE